MAVDLKNSSQVSAKRESAGLGDAFKAAVEVLSPGPHALASLRSTSAAGAAQEAAVLAALQLLHTALDLDEAAPGRHTARRHVAEQSRWLRLVGGRCQSGRAQVAVSQV